MISVNNRKVEKNQLSHQEKNGQKFVSSATNIIDTSTKSCTVITSRVYNHALMSEGGVRGVKDAKPVNVF